MAWKAFPASVSNHFQPCSMNTPGLAEVLLALAGWAHHYSDMLLMPLLAGRPGQIILQM